MTGKRSGQRGAIRWDVVQVVVALLTLALATGASEPVRVLAFACIGGIVLPVLTSLLLWRRRERRLTRAEQRALTVYLREHLESVRQLMPAGVTNDSEMKLADFLDDTLYVQPPWRRGQDQQPVTDEHLSAALAAALAENRNVLLVGEPGQGKTIALQRVYDQMGRARLRRGRRARAAAYPFLVMLRDLAQSLDALADTRDLAGVIAHHFTGFPLDSERVNVMLRSQPVVFLLDGMDEFGGTGRAILSDRLIPFLGHPVLMSSRQAFYDAAVRYETIHDRFGNDSIWYVDPLVFEVHGVQFIEKYAAFAGLTANPFRAALAHVPQSSEIVTRPLILLMVLDSLRARLAAHEAVDLTTWNVAAVYEDYAERWLRHEAQKLHGDRRSLADLKLEMAERLAWRVFLASVDPTQPYGHYETRLLTVRAEHITQVATECHARHAPELAPEVTQATLVSELSDRTFLLKSDSRRGYYFIHKSFFEFFLARLVHGLLIQGNPRDPVLIEALSVPLPDEVIGFLRGMLQQTAATLAASDVTSTFLSLYQQGRESDEDAAIMVRQQAVNLAPIAANEAEMTRLQQLMVGEPSPFVRRGLAVGVALHKGENKLMNRFVEEMRQNQDALAVHLGYNRMYYGDQRTDAAGWLDDEGRDCSRITRASIRQLGSEKYRWIWAMSLLTLRVLLADPKRDAWSVLEDDSQRRVLMDFVRQSQPDLGHVFERERIELKAVLDRAG